MKTTLRKTMSILLVVFMIATMVPMTFFSANASTDTRINVEAAGCVANGSDSRTDGTRINLVNDGGDNNTDAGILRFSLSGLDASKLTNVRLYLKSDSWGSDQPVGAYYTTNPDLAQYVGSGLQANTSKGWGSSTDGSKARDIYLKRLGVSSPDANRVGTVPDASATYSFDITAQARAAIRGGSDKLYIILVKESYDGSTGSPWSDTYFNTTDQYILYDYDNTSAISSYLAAKVASSGAQTVSNTINFNSGDTGISNGVLYTDNVFADMTYKFNDLSGNSNTRVDVKAMSAANRVVYLYTGDKSQIVMPAIVETKKEGGTLKNFYIEYLVSNNSDWKVIGSTADQTASEHCDDYNNWTSSSTQTTKGTFHLPTEATLWHTDDTDCSGGMSGTDHYRTKSEFIGNLSFNGNRVANISEPEYIIALDGYAKWVGGSSSYNNKTIAFDLANIDVIIRAIDYTDLSDTLNDSRLKIVFNRVKANEADYCADSLAEYYEAVAAVVDVNVNAHGYTTDDGCNQLGTAINNAVANKDLVLNGPATHSGGTATCVAKAVCAHCGASYGTVDSNNHNWNAGVVATAPTCTEEGIRTYNCTRDSSHTKTEAINSTGHTPVTDKAVLATCTATGLTEGSHCSVCKAEIVKQQVTEKLPHTEVVIPGTDATCTSTGLNAGKKCSVCQTVLVERTVIPALGHNYTGEIRSNNDGTHSFLCKNGCGTYGDLTNCTYTSEQKTAPTCTAKGTTTYTCLACDYSYDSNDLDMAPHTEGAAVESERVEATCTKDGSYKLTVRCTVCTAILSEETKTIPATGHNLVAHEAMSPTCDNAGYKAYNTCSRCDYTTKEEVPALGHNFDDTIAENVVTVVANCHEAGSKTVKCSRCDKTEVSTTAIDLTNHDGDEELRNRVTATCKEDGYTGDTYCTGCNTKISEGSVISKYSIAHSYGGWVVAFASTCSTMGTEKRTCSVCGDVDINALDYNSANHESVVTDDAVAATCSETGLTEGSHCSRCNAVIVEQQTVPMKDHTPSAAVRENEVAPSCITAGSYDEVVRCSVCNAIISSERKSVALADHNYGEWTTDVASTCKVQGSEKRVCSVCKAEETRDLPLDASNHANIVDDAAVAATCSETGLTAGKHCADCDTVTVAQTATDALGHDYIDHDAKAPTCTENGWAAYQTCSRCEYTTKTEIPASHTPAAAVQEDVVNATCTVEGSYKSVVYCSVCGEKLSSEDKVIEKAAHTYVDATCDQPATCSVCGYSSGAAIGHAWNDGVETTPATCENAGEKTYTCTRDASHTRTEVINALGHTYVDHDAKAPTCTEIGWNAYQTCENCTYSTYSGIKALGHAYEATVTAPTCSAQGYTTHTCSRCKDSYIDTYTAALTHTGGTANCVDKAICVLCGEAYGEVDAANHKSVVTDSAKAATCSETGLTEGSHCEACGNVITAQTVVDKAAHTPAAAVQENEVPATCKAEGSYDEVVKCSVCGDTLSTTAKTIEKLAHTEETITGTAATCKATGLTDGVKCSVCGEILTAQTVIEKLAHTPAAAVQENVVPATCKAAGSYNEVVKCSVCGDTLSTTAKIIDKLAHTEETITGTAATCKATGLTDGVKCSACGEILTAQTVIEKLAHTPAAAVQENVVPATCKAAGSYNEVVKCSVCGETLSTTAKTIEKLAHTEETITGTAATCKATGLTDGVKCSVCGEILTQQEEIAKLDHTPETTPGKAATCTAAGYTDKVSCSVCGTVITASTVIAAKGHKFGEWVTVSETETLVKLQRTCSACDAKETMEYSKEEVPKRSIRFNAMSNMHYVVNESLVIYNTTTAKAPVNVDVKFRVTTYSSFSSDGYIIYIDGVEAQPDADGYYTIPAGEDSVSVSISRAIEDTDNGSGSGSGTSTGKLSFWEWLLRLIRKILSVFKK